MTPENFAYLIQGMFEGKTSLTPEQQIQFITDHLKLVFNKVTPDLGAGIWGGDLVVPSNPLQDLPMCSTGQTTVSGNIAPLDSITTTSKTTEEIINEINRAAKLRLPRDGNGIYC